MRGRKEIGLRIRLGVPVTYNVLGCSLGPSPFDPIVLFSLDFICFYFAFFCRLVIMIEGKVFEGGEKVDDFGEFG